MMTYKLLREMVIFLTFKLRYELLTLKLTYKSKKNIKLIVLRGEKVFLIVSQSNCWI